MSPKSTSFSRQNPITAPTLLPSTSTPKHRPSSVSGPSKSDLHTPSLPTPTLIPLSAPATFIHPTSAGPNDTYRPSSARLSRGLKRGAGRGGRRAGSGRKPKIKVEEGAGAGTNAVAWQTPGEKPRNRGGRHRGRVGSRSGRGGKRKRGDEDDEEGEEEASEGSVIVSLPTQSRSGRRIFQAQSKVPAAIIDIADDEPQASPLLLLGDMGGKGKGKRRKVGEGSVCKNCGRGHSPAGNRIVFCDGCDTPWHQYCHDEPIGPEVVVEESREWFCAECVVLREERGVMKGRVRAAETMGVVEKRNYLRALPPSLLASLLLHVSLLHPDLPIYAPPSHQKPPYQSPYSLTLPSQPPLSQTTPSQLPQRTNRPSHQPQEAIPQDEDEGFYSDWDPLPYPKAGNGVRLERTEEEVLGILVDEEGEGFSHWWRGI